MNDEALDHGDDKRPRGRSKGIGLFSEAVFERDPQGQVKQKVQLFEGIDERVIHLQHNWWYPEQDGTDPHL